MEAVLHDHDGGLALLVGSPVGQSVLVGVAGLRKVYPVAAHYLLHVVVGIGHLAVAELVAIGERHFSHVDGTASWASGLQIEATRFTGKGRLVLTGQLGDVMKESASIALDYVRTHANEFKIDPKLFEENDVHIHVPEGAVPKDGPSAGVTMTTALVSCFSNIPVKANLAMTGEVTLKGNVLPIGGLKEKSLAAHRSGIDTILIPKENVKDLDDVPQEVKDAVTFIPCSNVSQVLHNALVK